MPNPVLVARSQLGGLIRLNGDPSAIRAARQRLAAALLERSIREALAADPPLAAEDRQRLGLLLGTGADA